MASMPTKTCFPHKEAGAPSSSLGQLAKLTLCWPRSICSPLSWGPGLCTHNLCSSCWVTHWVRRVWALENKRWRHFKVGEVKAVNIFEYLFAINSPTFGLFSLLQKELLRKYSGEFGSTSPLIHPISENLGPSGMVFIWPVLSQTCYAKHREAVEIPIIHIRKWRVERVRPAQGQG